MLLSPVKNGLTSLFKEVRAFKESFRKEPFTSKQTIALRNQVPPQKTIALAGALRKQGEEFFSTVGPTIITLHEFIVPGLIIELHYICSVCLN